MGDERGYTSAVLYAKITPEARGRRLEAELEPGARGLKYSTGTGNSQLAANGQACYNIRWRPSGSGSGCQPPASACFENLAIVALYLADRRDKARWVLDFTSGHGRYITVVNTAGFVLTPNWAVGGDLAGVTKNT